MPIYEIGPATSLRGARSLVGDDAHPTTIELFKFPENATYEDLMEHMESIPYLRKYKDIVTSFKDFYALELYAMKLAVNRGESMDYEYIPNEKEYEYAASLLKEAKRVFPEEFPNARPVTRQTQSTPGKINIWNSDKENAHLSNFAVRPFTISNTGFNSVPIAGTFKTVEGAFQAQKLWYSSMPKQMKEVLMEKLKTASGAEARKIGREQIKGLNTNEWDKVSKDIMYKLILASFQQNPQAAQQLIATGNAELTHTQAADKWKSEFPKILMQVRAELGGKVFTNNSGGARGSDSYWGKVGEQFGVRSRHFYDGERTFNGNTQISDEDRAEGQQKATQAAIAMYGLRGQIKSPLIIRDWSQVKYADSVFAVGTIVNPGEKINDNKDDRRTALITQVKGGTGYAVQMAIAEGKPVYVFDQERGRWFKNINGQWSESEVPVLTPNFAGIGTRDLKENGKKAIEEVYKKTFGKAATPGSNSASSQGVVKTLGANLLSQKNDAAIDSTQNTSDPTVSEETKKEEPAYTPDPNDVPKIGIEVLDVSRNDPRANLVRDFTPLERIARVEAISRKFTITVDNLIQNLKSILEEDIAAASSEEEKEDLKAQLRQINDPVTGRRIAIDAITFNKIYEQIKEEYEEYAQLSEEELEEEYGEGNGHIFKDKYQKIVDNFEALFEDACILIESAENLRVILDKKNYNTGKGIERRVSAVIEDSVSDTEKEEGQFGDDEDGSRTTGNEGWSYKVRFVDPYSSLSADVKRALHDIGKTLPNGDPALDDLGNTRYLDEAYIHAVLIDRLSDMIDADDFSAFDKDKNLTFPALEKIAESYPWVNQIINKLHADPKLASLFFADFRKDFIPYWKQKFDSEKEKVVTFALNQAAAIESAMNDVVMNYEHGTILDDDSIYDTSGKVNEANAKKGMELSDDILSSFQELEDDDDLERLISDIVKGLRMLGFNTSIKVVEALAKDDSGLLDLENVARAMGNVFEASLNLQEGEHLITALKESYEKIASVIGEVSEINHSSSAREGDKTFYSYSAPNYIDTMFKILKNNRRRQDYIDKEFKIYDWFYKEKTKTWRNEWLRLLENDPDVQDKLDMKELIDIDGKYYTEWEPTQIRDAFIMEYFSIEENKGSKKQFAWYNVPIFSDSPVVKFIKFIRYTGDFKSQILPLFNTLVRQELSRIKKAEDRARAGVSKIQNFDYKNEDSKGGAQFHFFPQLNSVMIGDKSFLDTIKEMSKEGDVDGIEQLINEQILIIMNDSFNSFIEEFDSLSDGANSGILDKMLNQGIAATHEGAMEKLEEYFWNQCFATSQIIQLTTTDLAYYKDITDFQKRYKEVYAAGTRLNTNSKYGRKTEKTIYLRDSIVTSTNYLDIKKNIMKAVKEGRISKMDADSILYKFRNVNATDAQAYRSISSYRAVLDMMGLWTDEMEASVNRLTHGEWDMADFNTVWQTIKPFVFTQLGKPDGLGGRMRVPHQHKNSEFLLLSTFAMMAGTVGKSSKLKALNRFMEDYEIDVAQFESSSKVGGQGIIDISVDETKVQEAVDKGHITVDGKKYSFEAQSFEDIKKHFDSLLDNDAITQEEYNDAMNYFEPSEEAVYEMLKNAVLDKSDKSDDSDDKSNDKSDDKSNNFKEEVVHEIPYKDYMVQQPTPEHLFDVIAVFGSQFRNLIISDMNEDMEITVNGQTIKGRDNILKLYQSLIVENLLEDYQKLSKKFATIEDLQGAMLEMVKGNPKYGRDMLDALRIVEHTVNGEKVKTFNIPLHNPTTTVKIQELVNSMFKNAIAKQHIKGANCILVSDFGFTDELKIVRNEDGSIKECQCYMPFYTKQYLEPFLKDVVDEAGKIVGKEVDIEAIKRQDPDLLKMVGYRIPTEGKYSMLPLVIKGFLPQQNGSSIMLPAEVTQIAGSDFDVDKLFIMLPEFNFYTHNMKAALNDFRAITRDQDTKNLIDSIFKTHAGKTDEDLDTSDLENEDYGWKEWWEENKDKYEYKQPKIKKVRYNNNKEVKNNNRRQRNNMIIDIAFGILTHKDTAEKINNPGSFDKPKLAARLSTISNDMDILDAFMEESGITTVSEAVSALLNSDLNTLNGIVSKYKKERNPLSPSTFVYYHKQNMTGGTLIGVYANNTTMQAKFQNTKLAIKSDYTFVINGREVRSLHDIYVERDGGKELVSRNCAEFSAASVDNVKDPVLADLLQNSRTAPITGLMLRAGMSIKEIGLMFSQPIVRECIEKSGSTYAIDAFLDLYTDKLKELGGGIDLRDLLSHDFTSEELLSNILMFNKIKQQEGSDFLEKASSYEGKDIREILASNIKSAFLFKHIVGLADYMKLPNKVSRADSPKNSIERSIARMKNQTQRVNLVQALSRQKNFPFTGMDSVIKNGFITPDMTIDEMRERLNNADMPMLQAFYSLGIDFGQHLTSRYFAQLNPYVNTLVQELMDNSPKGELRDKLLEDFYAELVTFGLSKSSVFGDDANNTFDQKRDYYLYDFPRKFIDIITNPDNQEIANLGIIKKLSVKDGEIIMARSGRLTSSMRESLMRDFDTMLYMNEDAQKLVLDLFMYSYYKYGLNFGPNSFSTFFSTNFLNSIPEVVNCLRDMSFTIEADSYWNRFLEQFYANHYSDISLVPSIKFNDKIMQGEQGDIIVPRKDVTVPHAVGNKVYKYVVMNKTLFQLDPSRIGEQTIGYTPVKVHQDSQKFKYNANMTAYEMAEVEVNQARVKAASSLSYTKEAQKDSLDDYDDYDLEALLGEDSDMDDLLSTLED